MRFLEPRSTGPTLGIRFWDEVLDQQVTDGLLVAVHLASQPGRPITAFQTGNGIYALRNLPGWSEGGEPEPLVIQVQDPLGRYLPVALPYRPAQAETHLFPPEGFFLFSAPTRPPQPGLAVIQGQLWDRGANRPAAWAVLEVTAPGGRTWLGMADHRGCVGMLLPYPVIPGSLLSESPPGPVTPVRQYQWPLTLQIRFGAEPLPQAPGTELPDLAAILTQPYGAVASAEEEPGAPEITIWLTFGQPLVLETDGLSRLLIDSGSPSP